MFHAITQFPSKPAVCAVRPASRSFQSVASRLQTLQPLLEQESGARNRVQRSTITRSMRESDHKALLSHLGVDYLSSSPSDDKTSDDALDDLTQASVDAVVSVDKEVSGDTQDADFFIDLDYLDKPELQNPVASTSASLATPVSSEPKPKDPALAAKAKQFTSALARIKTALPNVAVKSLFSEIRQRLNNSIPASSKTAELAKLLIDELENGTPEKQEDYLYLILKTGAIFDEAIASIDGKVSGESNLLLSVALEIVDDQLSDPTKLDRFGLMGLYKNIIDRVLGENKSIFYDALTQAKDGVLSRAGKDDPGSFSQKLQKLLYLAACLDTEKNIDTEEVVHLIQDIGIIATKCAQTLGGQANNPQLQDGGIKTNLLAACKKLQQFNKPMTPEEAKSQLALHYEKKLGPKWQEKLFQSLDFNQTFKTGTIAGVYKAVAANGKQVVVKIRKPGLEAEIAKNKVEIGKILNASYKILNEAVDTLKRLDQPVPDLLEKANLFQKSEASVNRFFDEFETELHFDQEAKNLMGTSCKTPKVISYTPNAIIMEFVENGMNPLEYVAISDKITPVNYKKANTAEQAITGWLQTHYPFDVEESGLTSDLLSSSVKVEFKDKSIEPLVLDVRGKSGDWTLTPTRPYLDYSKKARELISAQNIADLLTQLTEGVLNCDTHGGNFILAPGAKPGVNDVYNIDFGLVARIDKNERQLAWNLIKGILFKSEEAIAKTYFSTTSKGQLLSPEDYNKELKKFSQVLKDSHYIENIAKDPDQAMGPVMQWLAENDFDIDPKFYAIIRSFAGVASNAVVMQGSEPVSIRQLCYLGEALAHNKNISAGSIVKDIGQFLSKQPFESAVAKGKEFLSKNFH